MILVLEHVVSERCIPNRVHTTVPLDHPQTNRLSSARSPLTPHASTRTARRARTHVEMGPERVHRVFRDPVSSTRSAIERRDAVELITIQPLSYDAWLAAWSGNEGEDPLRGQRASEEELERVVTSVRAHAREETCCICLNSIAAGERESALPCGHGFHENCVGEWLRRSKRCPQCRRSLAGEHVENAAAVGGAGVEITEENAPTPEDIPWSATSDHEASEESEQMRRERYRSVMMVLHELRRDFEEVLRREVVERGNAEEGAERVRAALRALDESDDIVLTNPQHSSL